MWKQRFLTDDEVRKILVTPSLSNRNWADLLDVSILTIQRIRSRQTYWWVLPNTERPPTEAWLKGRETLAEEADWD
jgi:hypothetical protein